MSRRRTTAVLRPFIEVLEGRWVPTTLTPTTFLDGGLGSGSLRDAVLQFNADTGTDDDTIQLEAGTYALTIPNVGGRHESAGLTGDLNLTQTSHRWIIEGAGPSTIIDASQLQDRVVQIVNPGTQVVFQDLVIQGGLAQDNGADGVLAGTTDALGGGILNNGGNLTLDDVVVQNNVARGGDVAALSTPGHNGFGGGIYSTGGALTLAGATIASNQATGGHGGDSSRSLYSAGNGGSASGAGLYVSGGSLDISDSTIANNRATAGRGGDGVYYTYRTTAGTTAIVFLGGSGGAGQGGGLYVNGGSLTVASSTIASNRGTGGPGGRNGFAGSGLGGGLYISSNAGMPTVTASTLSGNSATGDYGDGDGGGIYNYQGTLTLSNSTLSGNSAWDGGGILSVGTLTVSNSTLSGNSAWDGGGIFNAVRLTVSDSTLSGNSADYTGGGGIDNNGGTVTVSNSILFDNSATGDYGDGGGIVSGGMLTVSNSTLSGNSARSGGGIDSVGTLTVSNSTLSGNSARNNGGGILSGGTVTVSSSTLSANSAANGGGISNSGTLTVSNSTLSGNSAGNGGAIYNSVNFRFTLTVSDSTLSGNSASRSGGGLYNSTMSASSPVLHNTLIAGNFGGATGTTRDDVSGPLDPSGDYNLIGDGTGMSGLSDGVNGNQVGSASAPIDPLLGPLQDNGGPTFTMSLLPGSPAIDAGNNAYATDWDQRGPGYPRIVNGIIDIGAFEVQAPAASRRTRQPLPDPVAVHALPNSPLLTQPPAVPADPAPLPDPATVRARASPEDPPLSWAVAPAIPGQADDSLGPLGLGDEMAGWS
jgi:hypothetical protein